MIAALPAEVSAYKQTPVFTESSIPAGLLKAHSTKAGTWGLLHVLDGVLIYRLKDERRPESEITVRSGGAAVIEPEVLHEVQPVGPVRFFVEFYR